MSTLRMEVTHESQVGHARRQIWEAAERLGADVMRSGEAAIVATELAENLVRHGQGGEVLLREIRDDTSGPALEIHALDKGPGMASVGACLRDGYSTAGSAGTGLGTVQRIAGQFQIHSQPGHGTAVWVHLPLGRVCASRNFNCGGVSVPVKGEDVCGDAWDFRETVEGMEALVVDGLGHGQFAGEAAREAVSVFHRYRNLGPSEHLSLMHEALFKTRGAAASIARLSSADRSLSTAGVGNVIMRLYGAAGGKTLMGDNGTLGASVRKTRELQSPWSRDSLLVFHSDGISSRWDLAQYPGLAGRHPGLIAGVIYRDFRHRHDDATVVVIRQSPP